MRLEMRDGQSQFNGWVGKPCIVLTAQQQTALPLKQAALVFQDQPGSPDQTIRIQLRLDQQSSEPPAADLQIPGQKIALYGRMGPLPLPFQLQGALPGRQRYP